MEIKLPRMIDAIDFLSQEETYELAKEAWNYLTDQQKQDFFESCSDLVSYEMK